MGFFGFVFLLIFSVAVAWMIATLVDKNQSATGCSAPSCKKQECKKVECKKPENKEKCDKKEAAPAAPKKKEEGDVPEHFHDNDELAAEATKIRDHARELRDEAHKPENRGEKYNQLMEEAKAEEARASKLVFERLNGGKHPKGTIDLHLQFVADAVRICDEEYEKIKNDGEVKEYVVIVGKGNHSEGGKAKVSPAIEEWADKKGLKHVLDEGKIICTL